VIRANLATRPFYNEGAVRLALLAVAVVAVVATGFNVTRIAQLSRRDTRMATQASSDETAGAAARARAARLRASVDTRALSTASVDAQQANELIDRRTFSWTDLFNRFETTLPDEVRFTSVRPRIEPKRGIVLTIIVAAKNVDDVNQFITRLQATGAFVQLEKRGEVVDEQNQLVSTLESVYMPSAVPAAGGGDR
jgi:Tfp pilus assembly protein PilN